MEISYIILLGVILFAGYHILNGVIYLLLKLMPNSKLKQFIIYNSKGFILGILLIASLPLVCVGFLPHDLSATLGIIECAAIPFLPLAVLDIDRVFNLFTNNIAFAIITLIALFFLYGLLGAFIQSKIRRR